MEKQSSGNVNGDRLQGFLTRIHTAASATLLQRGVDVAEVHTVIPELYVDADVLETAKKDTWQSEAEAIGEQLASVILGQRRRHRLNESLTKTHVQPRPQLQEKNDQIEALVRTPLVGKTRDYIVTQYKQTTEQQQRAW